MLSALAATAVPGHAENDTGCNVRLKGLKTLSDPQRKLVNLRPKNTTVAMVDALEPAVHDHQIVVICIR